MPAGRDPDAYDRLRRQLLWSMPTGLYVVGTRAGQRRNLMTISWVTQLSMTPKLIGIGVEVGAVTHALLEQGAVFALSFIPRSQRALVRRFVKPVEESVVDQETGKGTMNGESVVPAPSGAPVLSAAGAWIDCRVRQQLALGSHTLFVGEIVDCGAGAPGATSGGVLELELLRMEDTRMNYGG
ncbi:MAG: flavin reductase family protein [Acidimicrobiales bacterium]